MITVSNLSLSFNGQALFKNVDLKFLEGNCYGVIGANGAGKSTFLRILSGELEPSGGSVTVDAKNRMSVLKQDHFAFDEFTVLDTIMMGNRRMYEVMKQKDALYLKEDFTEEDGILASELEAEFAEMGGWEAETEAGKLLQGLGLDLSLLEAQMGSLPVKQKVKVLLAQALFGRPDIILLDEPTNHLDNDSITWLEDFLMDYEGTVIVARFSANKSKSRQATSRRKLLEKLAVEEMPASSRRYPFVGFSMDREPGKEILEVRDLSKTIDGVKVLDRVSFRLNRGDKVGFVGENEIAVTTLFRILMEEIEPDEGSFKWGVSTSRSYFPKDNSEYFDGCTLSILDWLRQYAPPEALESYLRGFLGKMLFSGDDVFKPVEVLSGGEKVRCMLSRMMMFGSNVLLLDQPTNHLDLESITAVNNGLTAFKGVVLFSSYDHEFIQTVANRIMEFTPNGLVDRLSTYDEYLEWKAGR